jgi:GNAT superfamily N-acetyltransferase
MGTAITCTALDHRAAGAGLRIWRDAAQWLVDRGQPLWSPAIFDERFLDDARARGVVVGARLEGVVVGIALLQWTDEIWWPDRPPDGAAYIHKVAVARAAAGLGVADALVHDC